MGFTEDLDKSLTKLTDIDSRLNMDSDLQPVASSLEVCFPDPSKVVNTPIPPPVNVNLRRDKVPLSDSLIREQEIELEPDESTDPEMAGDEIDDIIGPAPDEELPGEQDLPGTPGSAQMSVQQLKGQLDGLLKNWMDIAGEYPEGKKRHDWLEIGERLREISGVIQRDFVGTDITTEAIEGLPASHDPYEPTKRDDLGIADPDLAEGPGLEPPEEEPGVQPGPEDDIGQIEDPEQEGVPPEGAGAGIAEPPSPEQPSVPIWEPHQVPNKKDLAFKRSDGFMLRARSLESVPGKWLAQLYRDDKVIERGMLMIPNDVEPREYLQKMSDYMLDGDSERYQQQGTPEPGEEPETMPLDTEGPEQDLLDAGSEEDIGLDDEEFELDDGEFEFEESGLEESGLD